MPQPAAGIFQGISTPQSGPFDEYLSKPFQPRPIDQRLAPPTGYESRGVGIGKIALNFLQGVRQQRVANFLEEDKNRQAALNQYMAHVNSEIQNPDLNPAGRQKLIEAGNQTMYQHGQYETRDLPSKGIGGLAKNIFSTITGGKMATREPLDFNTETGRITNLAKSPEFSQTAVLNNTLEQFNQTVEQARQNAPGNMLNPSEVQSIAAKFYPTVLSGAPNKVQDFLAITGTEAAKNPYEEEMQRRQALMTREMFPDSNATTVPPQAPTEQPPPAGQAPIGPGGMAMAPTEEPPQAVAGAPVPAATRQMANPLARMDIRNPMARSILARFGMKVGEPKTLYNSTATESVSNAVYHPGRGNWVSGFTGEDLPDEQQKWVPNDQVRMPQVATDVMVAGSPTPGGSPQLFVGNKNTNTAKPMMFNGQPLYGNVGLEQIPGADGRPVNVIKPNAIGQPVPLPAAQEYDKQVKSAVSQFLGSSNNDYILAQEQLSKSNLPSEVKTGALAWLLQEYNKLDITRRAKMMRSQLKRDRAASAVPAAAPQVATPAVAPPAAATATPSSQYRRQ